MSGFTGGALGNIVTGMRQFDADERVKENHKWAGETHGWAGKRHGWEEKAAGTQNKISALNLGNLQQKQRDDVVYRKELDEQYKTSPGKAQALKLRGEMLPYQDELAYRKGLSEAKDENGKALNLSVSGERVKTFERKVITEEQAFKHQQALGNLQSTLRDYIRTKDPANLMKAFEAVPELKGEGHPAFSAITGGFTVKHNGKSTEVEPDAVFDSLIKSVPYLQHPDNWLKLMQKKEETQATRKHAIDMSKRGLKNSKELATHTASLKTGKTVQYIELPTADGKGETIKFEDARKELADIGRFLKESKGSEKMAFFVDTDVKMDDLYKTDKGQMAIQRIEEIAADKTNPRAQIYAQRFLTIVDVMYGAPAKGGGGGGANLDKQAYFKILDMVGGDKAKAREIMSLRAGSN